MSALNSNTLLALAAALALAACGGPRGPQNAGPQQSADPEMQHGALVAKPTALMFVDMDTNHDLATDTDELAAAIPALFAAMDADKSGTISSIEFSIWAEATLGTRYPVPGLARFDTNGSLSIDPNELGEGLQTVFAGFDSNNNGHLSRTELLTELNMPVGRHGAGRIAGGGAPGGGRPDGGGRPGGGRPAT